MTQLLAESGAGMDYGLVLAISLALMLVVYVLSDSRNPPAGLGMYTVYFMASLLGWVSVALQSRYNVPLALDVTSVAAIISTYILLLAAAQRAGVSNGRLVFGVLGLGACLSAFFLSRGTMFVVHTATLALLFAGTAVLAGGRAWRQRNIGDAIVALAGLVMLTGVAWINYRYLSAGDLDRAEASALNLHGVAYALVAVGFLAGVLTDYQQQLSHLATEDPLTRLLNQRGQEEALRVSLAAASRGQLPVSALLLDIDGFRQVNDSFGHETGDRVLQVIARIMQQHSRATDVIARVGGDDFLLVLPDTDLTAARVVAERIRDAVGEQPLLVDDQEIPVTVSLGVSGGQGDINLDELRRQANRAMALAKRGGRNRVSSVQRSPVHLSTPGTGR
jgi:diguanylate cyclase (GGDEF)-like protein